MKKCSFCGEINPDSTEICPWCGRPDPNLIREATISSFWGGIVKRYKYSILLALILFAIFLLYLVFNNLSSNNVTEGLAVSPNEDTQVITITPKNTLTQLIAENSGKIVFSSNRDLKDYDIFIIGPDGKDQSKLTNNEFGNIYWDPSWSPDGRHIVFSCIPFGSETSEIFIMDSDGSNQTQLTKKIIIMILSQCGHQMEAK